MFHCVDASLPTFCLNISDVHTASLWSFYRKLILDTKPVHHSPYVHKQYQYISRPWCSQDLWDRLQPEFVADKFDLEWECFDETNPANDQILVYQIHQRTASTYYTQKCTTHNIVLSPCTTHNSVIHTTVYCTQQCTTHNSVLHTTVFKTQQCITHNNVLHTIVYYT